MDFPQRLKECRKAAKLSQAELALMLGVSPSAVGNYEKGVSFPKEDVLMRMFDCLQTDPNTLFQGSYQKEALTLSSRELELLRQYRQLSRAGRESVHTVVGALRDFQDEMEQVDRTEEAEEQLIPLYRSPAAAGYASPVFGEDFDYIQVTDAIPKGADFAVRIQGDSMIPWIQDGSVIYVNRDPLRLGDVGIFCVDGSMLCKQYYRDSAGNVYLFSLNRARSDADVLLTPGSGQTLVCFGRVMMKTPPPPGRSGDGWRRQH